MILKDEIVPHKNYSFSTTSKILQDALDKLAEDKTKNKSRIIEAALIKALC